MKHKRILGGLALAVAGMTALAACSSSSSSGSSTPSSSTSASQLKSGGTFTYAIDQDVAGFNVLQATDNEFVLQEILNQVWPQSFVSTNSLNLQLDTDYFTRTSYASASRSAIRYPGEARPIEPGTIRCPGELPTIMVVSVCP